jgi:hypothetical protein
MSLSGTSFVIRVPGSFKVEIRAGRDPGTATAPVKPGHMVSLFTATSNISNNQGAAITQKWNFNILYLLLIIPSEVIQWRCFNFQGRLASNEMR